MFDKIVFPGTFDPLTNGHIDIINRAQKFAKKLIIAVCNSSINKEYFFPIAERKQMIQAALGDQSSMIEVVDYTGLTADMCRQMNASCIVRGVRNTNDFSHEYDLFTHNQQLLMPELEVILLPAKPEFSYISSRLVKEIARYGGDVGQWVPASVLQAFSHHHQKNI